MPVGQVFTRTSVNPDLNEKLNVPKSEFSVLKTPNVVLIAVRLQLNRILANSTALLITEYLIWDKDFEICISSRKLKNPDNQNHWLRRDLGIFSIEKTYTVLPKCQQSMYNEYLISMSIGYWYKGTCLLWLENLTKRNTNLTISLPHCLQTHFPCDEISPVLRDHTIHVWLHNHS